MIRERGRPTKISLEDCAMLIGKVECDIYRQEQTIWSPCILQHHWKHTSRIELGIKEAKSLRRAPTMKLIKLATMRMPLVDRSDSIFFGQIVI